MQRFTKRVSVGLAALLISTSVYAQQGAGGERGPAAGGRGGADASMKAGSGGGAGDRAGAMKGGDTSMKGGDTSMPGKASDTAARNAEAKGPPADGNADRMARGKDRTDSDRGGRRDGDRVAQERRGDRTERRSAQTDVRTRTDVRTDRAEGGIRREGRFVVVGGRRVVYGSPEYRRLVVTERRGPRERYVVVRGQRVIYGSPEYRRLVSVRETGPRERYVVIRGQRVIYGSPEYRRLTVTQRGGTVNASFRERTENRTRTDVRGGRDEARTGGKHMERSADRDGKDGVRNGNLRGDSDKGGVRNASDTGGDRGGMKPAAGEGAKTGGAKPEGGRMGADRGGMGGAGAGQPGGKAGRN